MAATWGDAAEVPKKRQTPGANSVPKKVVAVPSGPTRSGFSRIWECRTRGSHTDSVRLQTFSAPCVQGVCTGAQGCASQIDPIHIHAGWLQPASVGVMRPDLYVGQQHSPLLSSCEKRQSVFHLNHPLGCALLPCSTLTELSVQRLGSPASLPRDASSQRQRDHLTFGAGSLFPVASYTRVCTPKDEKGSSRAGLWP